MPIITKKDPYLSTQIITYMGNKRKLLSDIKNVIEDLQRELGIDNQHFSTADAFSGSGIVSRLLKTMSNVLYTNDVAGYSQTLNQCFLSTLNFEEVKMLKVILNKANQFAYSSEIETDVIPWISRHWSPSCERIQKSDRVYFTHQNGILIDRYMHFIQNGDYPKKYRPFLLSQLLVKSSIHTNTSGQFSAFYKDHNGVGKYGGEKEIDLHRITKPIELEMPVLSNNPCDVYISRMDALDWVKTIPEVDVMYLDPPYNKHSYATYYFMLDIINDWDTETDIPNTNRGQPKNWLKSDYNSTTKAVTCFTEMYKHIKAKFVMLSYNNKGIIPIKTLEKILSTRGKVLTYPVNHKTYNRMKGIASYKRVGEWEDVKEFIWVVDMR